MSKQIWLQCGCLLGTCHCWDKKPCTALIVRPEPWAHDDPYLDFIIWMHDSYEMKERLMAVDEYFERRMEAFALPRVNQDDLVSACCLSGVYDSWYGAGELPGYPATILFTCCQCGTFCEPLSPYQSPKLKEGKSILTIECDAFGNHIHSHTTFIKVEYTTKAPNEIRHEGRSFSKRYFNLLMALPGGIKAVRAAVKYGLGL